MTFLGYVVLGVIFLSFANFFWPGKGKAPSTLAIIIVTLVFLVLFGLAVTGGNK